jgi:hypothetical protein
MDLYEDPKVEPAPDAAPFPSGGIATYYTKGGAEEEISPEEIVEEAALEEIEEIAPEEIAEEAGAYIELLEEGNVTVRLPGIARHHAVVRVVEGKIIIEDLKSTIGTFFKGIRIETKELNHNDEINIKDFTLRLDWPAGARMEPEEQGVVKEPPAEEPPDLSTQTIYHIGYPEDTEKKEASPLSVRTKRPI